MWGGGSTAIVCHPAVGLEKGIRRKDTALAFFLFPADVVVIKTRHKQTLLVMDIYVLYVRVVICVLAATCQQSGMETIPWA